MFSFYRPGALLVTELTVSKQSKCKKETHICIHPHSMARTNWISQQQNSKTILDFNATSDDGEGGGAEL